MDSKTLNYLKNRISYVDPNEAYNKLREYGAKYQGASDSYFDEFNRLSTWADPYKIDRTDPISMFKDDIKQFDAENKDEDTITDKLTGKTYTRAEIKNLTMNNYLKDVEASITGKSNPLYDIGKTATTIGYGMAEGMGQAGLAKIGANAISEATGMPKTENYSAELANSIGASEDSTARRIGNVAGSVVQGMTLGALGVPPAATYGIQSGLRTYGSTNDVGDIAVETGLGAVYGTLFNGISGALKTASAKAITGVGNAIYTSLLQNLGINLATSTAGAYSANAITGTVRNVYNKIRDREVDWTQPLFSKDAVINALVSGAISGTIGTINDIRSAPAQARADTQNALRSLDNLKKQMADSARTGDARGYNQAYIKGQQIIYALSKLKYLGFKLNSEELSSLANAWSDTRSMINLTYALDGGATTPTTSTSGYMPMPSMPTTTTGGNTPIVYTPPTSQSSSITNQAIQPSPSVSPTQVQTVQTPTNTQPSANIVAQQETQTSVKPTTTTPQNNTEPTTPRANTQVSDEASKIYDERLYGKESDDSNPFSRQVTTSRGTLISDDLADFTKNSEARDSGGKIMEVYHGTPENFTEFKDEFIGKNNGKGWGDGFYFTAYYNDAKEYAGENGNIMTEVLNIEKPLYSDSRFKSLSSKAKELIAKYEPKATTSQPYIDYVENKLSTAIGTMDYAKSLAQKNGGDTRPILKFLGFDGIIDGDRYVIFDRTQAKDIKNIHPTNDPDTLKEPSENFEPKAENSNKGSFSMPKVEGTTKKYVPQTKRKFLKDFEQVGYIDVNGSTINSADDLADLAQIFRDPTVETFRLLLTDENGKTLTQLAYTSNLPDRVNLSQSSLFDDILADIKKYTPSKIWVLHNHPTGDVTPSGADKQFTTSLIDKLPRYTNNLFGGHVIIDHNKYSLIKQNDKLMGRIEIETDIPLRKPTTNNLEDSYSKEGWVDFKVNTPEAVAEIASDINNNKEYSTLIFTDVKNKAVVLQEVPNKFLRNTEKYLNSYFKRVGRENGATKVSIATQDETTFDNISKNLNINDAVLYSTDQAGGIQVVASSARSGARIKSIFPSEEPAHRLTAKKSTEPKKKLTKKQSGVEPSLEKANKDIAKLEKANQELRDKLAKKQEKSKERLAKKDKEIDDLKQSKKDALRKKTEQVNKREEKQKEERSLKRLEPEKRLPKLVSKAKAQQQEYAESEFPEVSEKFENEFGKTIRDIISTLANQKIMRKLPDKLRELITNYKNETYLKANWKSFDKYLREAIADKQLRNIINNSNTPVSDKLLSLIQEHNQAPIVVQTAAEMKKELDDLIELVNAVKQSLEFAKADQELEKTREAIKMELDPIIEKNLKTHNARSETVDAVLNSFNKAGREFSTALMFFPTRIQATMNGNPDSNMNILWKNIERGSETEMRLDVEKSRLFDKFFENPNSRNFKLKGELAKDFEENPKWEETNTPVGRATRLMMMSIYGMTMNKDNLMHITPVLLGTTEDGEGIYSKPGGLIIPEERAYKRGDLSTAYANGKTVKLTQEDIDKIVNMLTPIEKDFVKTCVQDVADFIAKEGNPVSMNLTGRELFHPNYLRILVSDDALDPEMIDPAQTDQMSTYLSTMDTGLEGRMGRGGSLQGRTHKSTRPIYLEDLWRATSSSINGAIKYIAYAEALYDNDLILKTKFPNTYKKVGEITEAEAKKKTFGAKRYIEVDELPKNGNGTYIIDNGNGYDVYEVDTFGKTMSSLIAATGDDKFMKYYKDYIQTLLYGVGSTNALDQAVGRLAGMRARVVLNANIKVAINQQLSRPLIWQFLEHPTKSFIKGFADKSSIYKLAEEYLKNVGSVDTTGLSKREMFNRFLEFATYMNSYRGLGKYSQDVEFLKDQKKGLGRIDLGWLMTMNDRSAVDFTFRVLIEDILNGRKEFTEEDMKELQNRAWQVARSNPSYLRAYKTPWQMAKSSTVRSLSQFKTVMLLGCNNFLYASMAENYYKNNGEGNKAKEWAKKERISGAGLIIASIASAIIDETLSTMFDKEGTKDLPERILKSAISKTLSYTIIGGELFQWFMGEGYDLSTNDLGYANQLKNALTYFGKIWSSEDSKKPSVTINFAKSVGSMMGLPMNSLENIFTLVGNVTDSDLGKAYKTIKNPSALKKWIDKQEQLNGTSIAEFYDMYEATRNDSLESKYEWIKGSSAGTYNAKEFAKKRAIADVLGYPKKNLTQKQASEINRYYQIFK